MDNFNESGLSPEELKMLTLQFMGQHLTGDLKSLEQNIIAKNNTLRGMFLDPAAVISSIPAAQVQTPPELTTQQHAPPQLTPVYQSTPAVTPAQQPIIDQNQLEFNFNTSPLSERIFESLQRIEKQLLSIDERLLAIEDFKKKDSYTACLSE